MENVMLEHYFVKPSTLDRIRGSWLASPIERYVEWLEAHGYGNEKRRHDDCRIGWVLQIGSIPKKHRKKSWSTNDVYGH
jgi:integrase/recombinase XerD